MTFFVLVCLTFLGEIDASELSSCVTPSNKNGTCMPVKNCTKLNKMLHTPGIVFTPSEIEDFEARKCKTDTEMNYICCDDIFDFKNCGLVDGESRVSNALNASLFQFPWMALLEYKDSDGNKTLKCGGSLISKNYVLTAGHCINEELVSVVLGEYQISTKIDCKPSEDEDGEPICAPAPQVFLIDKTILHPDYSKEPGAPNDIALVRLEKPAELGASVNTICLPIKLPNEVYSETSIIVMGFGITDNSSKIPDILQYASISKVECSASYYLYEKDKQFCAGGKHYIGTCSGDSGGSLVIFNPLNQKQQVQVGIVSAGPQCAVFEEPGIYTKVEHFIDWIVETVVD